MKRIVLASSSPRRKEILQNIGFDFEIMNSNVEENIEFNGKIEEFVEKLAYLKAKEVADKLSANAVVIGADTVVYTDKILGKPVDQKDAYNMLKTLSNQEHFVYTGIAVIDQSDNKVYLTHEKTVVKFREVSDEEIWGYIATKEPLDKAGAYGIQGKAAVFIEKIDGCYFNVVGLPVFKLYDLLRKVDVCIPWK